MPFIGNFGAMSARGFNPGRLFTYSATYLIVAGGGSGGSSGAGTGGGGGNAGGLLSGNAICKIGTVYSFTVGGGGTLAHSSDGHAGTNSTGFGLTAAGGNAGIYAINKGGDGAGGAGGAQSATGNGGVGGVGVSNSITGSAVYYAGGGGGGGGTSIKTGGAGGNGGGGNGGSAGAGQSGTNNYGGGSGGGGQSGGADQDSGTGGSGVVIISVPTVNYSGTTTGSPTVTTSGSNTIVKFTASGSYTA